jgi:glycosyltransferase involved in cell wall biosynthesis
MRRGAPDPDLKKGRRFLCCYLGVMGPQDGVDLLLRAVDCLVHELGEGDCQFALLGFGDCFADLQRLTQELHLEDWVDFPGRADDEMILRYLSTADLGLSPDPRSPFNEISTMNKTMEYMACGLPVVTFDLRETRFSAADAAMYVEPNDTRAFAKAIRELLSAPNKREEMGRKGRERVEQVLAWEHQAGAYLGVYERLVGASSGRRTAGLLMRALRGRWVEGGGATSRQRSSRSSH